MGGVISYNVCHVLIVADPVWQLSKSRAEHEMPITLIRLIQVCLVWPRVLWEIKMDLQRYKEVMVLSTHQSYLGTNRAKPTELIQDKDLMSTGCRKTKEDLERIITVLCQYITCQAEPGQLTSTIGSRLMSLALGYGPSDHSTDQGTRCFRKFVKPQSLQIRQLIRLAIMHHKVKRIPHPSDPHSTC